MILTTEVTEVIFIKTSHCKDLNLHWNYTALLGVLDVSRMYLYSVTKVHP
jgi:hypothetical protein